MAIVEEHRSPDGFLRLIVERDEDGDVAVGFDGYVWHTHADLLASWTRLPEEEGVRQFVDAIVGEKQIIAVSRIAGKVHDVWPTEDPDGEFKYKPDEESLEFRRWSGEVVKIDVS